MLIKGNGSIIPLENKSRYKCRKWRLYVTTECGQRSRNVAGTWTEAKTALERFKLELSEQPAEQATFQAYAQSWIDYREQLGTLAPGTIANNKREIAALNRSALASLELSTIAPTDCKNALIWIKQHPVRKRGELSNTTMNKLYITLSSILSQAVDDELIPANPMRKVKPPKVDTKERDALAPKELMGLVSRLSTLPLDGRTMALYFMSLCGLRRGEACALSVNDVDNGVLCVHLAIKERNGKIDEPKSKAAIRFLPMPQQLIEKVDEWNQIRTAKGLTNALTLCCNSRGGVLRPQNLQRWWTGDAKHNGVRDKLGCADMTLHQLRHSNLSMVARYMSPYDLQRYAGWSSIEPARIYIHADLSNIKRAISQIYAHDFADFLPE